MKTGQAHFKEGQGHFYGRAGLFLWKGRTVFMEGQDRFYGRAEPFLWKGRQGQNYNIAIRKLLIPGRHMHKW